MNVEVVCVFIGRIVVRKLVRRFVCVLSSDFFVKKVRVMFVRE